MYQGAGDKLRCVPANLWRGIVNGCSESVCGERKFFARRNDKMMTLVLILLAWSTAVFVCVLTLSSMRRAMR